MCAAWLIRDYPNSIEEVYHVVFTFIRSGLQLDSIDVVV